MNNTAGIWGTWIFILLVYGIMPFMTQKTVVFGVRIPPDMHNHPFLTQILRRYLAGEGILAVLIILLIHFTHLEINQGMGSAILLGLTLVLFTLDYMLAHFSVSTRKKREGWYENRRQASLADTNQAHKLSPWVWLWWEIPAWALALALTVVGITRYPYLPARIPVHFNNQGVANGWMTKSISVIIFPLSMTVGSILLLTGILWLVMTRTHPDLDPSDPKGSLNRSIIFRRRMIITLGVAALAATVTTALTALSTWDVVPSADLPKIIPIVLFVALAAIFAVTMKTGQEGRNLPYVSTDSTTYVHYDDDRFWKGGILYYNPNDPKMLVDKRFGIGWTLNFARPSVWIGLAILILIALFPFLLHGGV